MKRKTKLVLGGITLLLGAVVLSGCTASFCTVTDKAHMLYAFDYGITDYVANDTTATNVQQAYAYIDGTKITFDNVKYKTYETREEVYNFCSTYKKIDESATKNGIRLPSFSFLNDFDAVVLGHAIQSAYADSTIKAQLNLPADKKDLTLSQIQRDYKDANAQKGILDIFGYIKYEDSVNNKKVLWTNFTTYLDETKAITGIDAAPSNDYWKLYKSSLNSSISSYRSCLAIKTGDYGAYGPRGTAVEIQGKKWTDWKGLLEFILVWPIGAFVDVLTSSFLGAGVIAGAAQMLAILIVTFVIRGLMMVFTIKQSSSSAKMNELQPEIAKIQAKYPNSNTDTNQKQRMAAEMQKLYKKHGINPMSSILVMIVQFPVFICVWGALQGSAYLSSGQLFGLLRFSDSISTALFNASNWATGTAEVALGLFLLMSAAQTVAMLLPQWIQKRKSKDVAKLGNNPAQKQNANRMKWFTYIMLAMIIFMGFSLASGMGIYWLFGAIFSVVQTLIMQKINDSKAKKAKYGGKSTDTVDGRRKGK